MLVKVYNTYWGCQLYKVLDAESGWNPWKGKVYEDMEQKDTVSAKWLRMTS